MLSDQEIKNKIYLNKVEIRDITVDRYVTIMKQLLTELSSKQIIQDPFSIYDTDIVRKNKKSTRLYLQAILAYFGKEKFTQLQLNKIQDEIHRLNQEHDDQVSNETIDVLQNITDDQIQEFLKQVYKKGLDQLQSKRSPSNAGITKYLILSMIYNYQLRVGEFSDMQLLDNQNIKIKRERDILKIFDQNENQLKNDSNYAIISKGKVDLIINVFKTADKYKQKHIVISKGDLQSDIIVDSFNLLLNDKNKYISQTVTKNAIKPSTPACLSTKVKKWMDKGGFKDLSANDLAKISINQLVRQDVQNLKQISKNRGTDINTLLNHYQKLDEKIKMKNENENEN